jgi:hypothetical protein
MLVAFADGPYASVAQTRFRVLQRSRRGVVHQFNVGARPILGSDLAAGLLHSAQDDSLGGRCNCWRTFVIISERNYSRDPPSTESDCRNAMTSLIYQREKPRTPQWSGSWIHSGERCETTDQHLYGKYPSQSEMRSTTERISFKARWCMFNRHSERKRLKSEVRPRR